MRNRRDGICVSTLLKKAVSRAWAPIVLLSSLRDSREPHISAIQPRKRATAASGTKTRHTYLRWAGEVKLVAPGQILRHKASVAERLALKASVACSCAQWRRGRPLQYPDRRVFSPRRKRETRRHQAMRMYKSACVKHLPDERAALSGRSKKVAPPRARAEDTRSNLDVVVLHRAWALRTRLDSKDSRCVPGRGAQ